MSKSFNPYYIAYLFVAVFLLYVLGVYTFYSPHFEAFTGIYIIVPQMLGVFIAIPTGLVFCLVGVIGIIRNDKNKKRYVFSGGVILVLQLLYIALIDNGYYLTV